MATVNKDFKIKSGLIVEGSSATIGGFDVLTKKQGDQDYIVGLIGGTATSANTANTVVKRDASGNFAAGAITANLTGSVTGTVSSLSNHNTAALAEGTNLYFTNARALSATAAAYDAAGAATTAQANAASDATSKANAAQSAAISAAATDATTKANNAQSAAISAAATDATTKANAAQSAATTAAATDATTKVAAARTAVTTEIATAKSEAITASGTYTDGKISALINGAPTILDTLGEIAAQLAADESGAATLTTLVSTKAPLASPALTGVPTAPTAAAGTNTTQVATTAYAKAGADAAQTAAATDATSKVAAEAALRVSGDAASVSTAAADATSKVAAEVTARNTAIATAISTEVTNRNTAITTAVDAINTDVIEEGTSNLYFTGTRAKSSAADLLIGATKSNITITGSGAGLVITAENGVMDSTTSDLVEGSNLYFTNARAVSAVQAVVPNFTSVDLNSVAKQVAATLSAPTAGVQTAHTFAKATYRSAEYLVKVAYSTHTEISKVLLTLDTSDNIAITEYGVVGTNGSLSSVSANISGANVQLLVTTTNNNSTVTVMGTLLK